MNDIQKNYLKVMAGWQKFLGIMMIIFSVLFVVLAVVMMAFGPELNLGEQLPNNVGIWAAAAAYIICAILYMFLAMYLLRSANSVQAGFETGDEEQFTKSLQNTKSFFKFNGILMIIGLSVIVLALIVSMLAFALM